MVSKNYLKGLKCDVNCNGRTKENEHIADGCKIEPLYRILLKQARQRGYHEMLQGHNRKA